MNYPLISEYVEAIKAAEDNFEKLRYLRPVLSDDGLPVMTSGNFAVVFKMRDERDGRLYAVKCFTKEQTGRAEAYHQIAEELKDVDSPYLVSLHYLEKELFVDTDQTDETEFPVLQMDWVEGKTLDKYLRENLDDKYALEMLAYRFSRLAQWLIPQPFAHGDLKPENILVREDGSLVLVDYDGMYVPSMKGQKARELGSPDFRHPLRTENDFDEHIDDFPIVSILLSLKGLSIEPFFMEKYFKEGRLLLSCSDYIRFEDSVFFHKEFPRKDNSFNSLIILLLLLLKYKIGSSNIFELSSKQLSLFGDYNLWQLAIHYSTHLIKRINSFDEYVHIMVDIFGSKFASIIKSTFAGVLFLPDNKNYLHKFFDEFIHYNVDSLCKFENFDPLSIKKGGIMYREEIAEASEKYWNIFDDVFSKDSIIKSKALCELVSFWKRGYVISNDYTKEDETKIEISVIDNNFSTDLYVYNFLLLDILSVHKEDVNEGYKDELGVIYSNDKKQLLTFRDYTPPKNPFPSKVNNGKYSIKDGTTIIRSGVFQNCDSCCPLQIVIPDSVLLIGNLAFSNSNIDYIHVPNPNMHLIGNPFAGLSGIIIINSKEYVVREDDNGVQLCYSVFSKDYKTLIHCGYFDVYECGGISEVGDIWEETEYANPYIFPAGVECIGFCAFYGCNIEELIIPEGVVIIHDYAFANSKVKKIHLPKSLSFLGNNVLDWCSSLKYIYVSKQARLRFKRQLFDYRDKIVEID